MGEYAHLSALVEDLCDLEGDVLGVGPRRAQDDVDTGRQVVESLDARPGTIDKEARVSKWPAPSLAYATQFLPDPLHGVSDADVAGLDRLECSLSRLVGALGRDVAGAGPAEDRLWSRDGGAVSGQPRQGGTNSAGEDKTTGEPTQGEQCAVRRPGPHGDGFDGGATRLQAPGKVCKNTKMPTPKPVTHL